MESYWTTRIFHLLLVLFPAFSSLVTSFPEPSSFELFLGHIVLVVSLLSTPFVSVSFVDAKITLVFSVPVFEQYRVRCEYQCFFVMVLFPHLPLFALVSSICECFAPAAVLSFDRVCVIMVLGMLLMCDAQSWNIVVMYLFRCCAETVCSSVGV